MTLNLKPDVEARLIALARASGVSLEVLLQNVVEERSGLGDARRLNPQEWVAQFEEWADSFSDGPPIPDEALNRESLYPDRW